MASKSKGGGKSSGFNIITYLLKEVNNGYEIYLLTIYDKSEESGIDKATLLALVKRMFE